MKNNLNVYYSAACNLQCTYCGAAISNPEENNNIREAIINGTFQNYVIQKCQELQPVTLGLWGLEPTINQDLWSQFIIPILNNCSTIKGIFFSTNGTLIDTKLWYTPLESYCINHQRKIKLWIQFSINMPNNNISCNNLYKAITDYTTNPYFKLKLSTKSTWIQSQIYSDQSQWFNGMHAIHNHALELAPQNCDVSLVGYNMDNEDIESATYPTMAIPGNYVAQDGAFYGIQQLHRSLYAGRSICNCAAGISSWTITYDNQVYDCPLKKNKQDCYQLNYQDFLKAYNNSHPNLLYNTLSPETLYQLVASHWCWGLSQKTDIPSYIALYGNYFTYGERK